MVLTAVDAWICNSAVDGRRRRAPPARGVKRVAGGGRGDNERGVLWEMATEVVEGRCCRKVFEPGDEVQEAADDQDVERESVSVVLFVACSSGSILVLIGIKGVASTDGSESTTLPISVKGVMGVPCPLPATAPVEFFSQKATVGVAMSSEACLSCSTRGRGMFSCGNGYVLLADISGDGGAMGECQDSVLWNESNDSAGDRGSGIAPRVFSTTLLDVEGDVRSFRDGVAAARRDAKAANLVRLTRTSPDPSNGLPSSVSDSSSPFWGCALKTSDDVCGSIVAGGVNFSVTLLSSSCVAAATASPAGPADCALYIADLSDTFVLGEGVFVLHIGSCFCSTAGFAAGVDASMAVCGSAGSSTFGVTVVLICGRSSLAFPDISGGLAVSGDINNGSGSSTSGLNAISDTRLLGVIVGVSLFCLSWPPSASALVPGFFVSGVEGVKLILVMSKPKSEWRRAVRVFGL